MVKGDSRRNGGREGGGEGGLLEMQGVKKNES